MAQIITNVNTAADTFGDLIDKTNEIASVISNYAITANSTQGVTSGNAYLNGKLAANTIAVVETLRGGNTSVSANLVISSNLTSTEIISSNTIAAQKVSFSNVSSIVANTKTISSTTTTVIDSFAIATNFAKYLVSVKDGSTGRKAADILVVNDGTDVLITEYGSIESGSLGLFSANIAAGNVNLLFTAVGANATNQFIVNATRVNF